MKKWLPATLCICLALTSGVGTVSAQNSHAAHPAGSSYDMRGQSLSDLESLQKKFVDLANAIPADKLAWRPSPDTRSFAELFLHVAGKRYVILGLMGVPVPAQFEPMLTAKATTDFETSTPKDKARIIEELNKSWEFTKKTLRVITNADFTKPLPKPGRQANDGDLIYLLVADQHEHLGQAVAYARVNGIVPPWSSTVQKARVEKGEQSNQPNPRWAKRHA